MSRHLLFSPMLLFTLILPKFRDHQDGVRQMSTLCPRLLVSSLLAAFLIGCGGGGSGPQTASQNPTSTAITFTFVGVSAPASVAVQIGSGPFLPVDLQSGAVTFTVPGGTNQYSVAYLCVSGEEPGRTFSETILQATIKDGTAFSPACSGSPSATTGQATGSADASLIPGATDIEIIGNQAGDGRFFVGSTSGPFTADLPVGANDVAAIALAQITPDTPLAIRIIRNQTVPGAINGGGTITFGPADQLTNQALIVNNVPADFDPASATVGFQTANKTSFFDLGVSNTEYLALPVASVQSGDLYVFEATSSDTATHTSTIGVVQAITNGGGPTTLALPDPFSGPTISFPTFTFNYAGFASKPTVLDEVQISWLVPGPVGGFDFRSLTVSATGNFLNGSNALAVPNPFGAGALYGPPGSGTSVTWSSAILGGTNIPILQAQLPLFAAIGGAGTNKSSFSFVKTNGTLTVP
jgi:hypothetical protein